MELLVFIGGLGLGVILGVSGAAFFFRQLKTQFADVSVEALSRSSEQLVKLAQERLTGERELSSRELEGKKELIDQQLVKMKDELEKVTLVVQGFEKDRVQKFSELTLQLKNAGEQTSHLIKTTQSLKEALSNSRIRGQWGERMAEDVLKIAGFLENVNYLKQQAFNEGASRPDFTFLLPKDLKLHMDVKFPLDNYMRFLEATNEHDKLKFKKEFLKDIRDKIKDLTTRDYISPEQNTVDYVLLFIPNEQIYGFIQEHDRDILDEGLKNKVVFCSPVTLFAILAVIRQAVENFSLEKTSHEILGLFGAFKKQWELYIKKFEGLGKRLEDVQGEYEQLIGTRKRMLERPLQQIENLRTERGIEVKTLEIQEPLE